MNNGDLMRYCMTFSDCCFRYINLKWKQKIGEKSHMIKVITLGLQSPNSTMQIIQRGGKKFILALCITIETSAANLADAMPNTPVSFGIEEVPFAAVKKAFAESDPDKDIGALIALKDGSSYRTKPHRLFRTSCAVP
ncbi:hypothetical protein [Sinorhizobium psoraleae]|uniref:Uncharacterized protein n=1 Tax=Sinorhizobium psoraleae TaxID=520838 RepID=A0ABT4KAS9_9HYPH|nr:hypothetical protein [Sinorhizobium psoraleae]MCZ4089059.1 hypothetical protein [Sinorhizobium psoraleae]